METWKLLITYMYNENMLKWFPVFWALTSSFLWVEWMFYNINWFSKIRIDNMFFSLVKWYRIYFLQYYKLTKILSLLDKNYFNTLRSVSYKTYYPLDKALMDALLTYLNSNVHSNGMNSKSMQHLFGCPYWEYILHFH